MLMPDDPALIRDRHRDFRVGIEDDALASEAAFEARVAGAVDKILFFFTDFFEKLVALFDVNMTSRTGADAAAVVVEVHVHKLGDLQNGEVGVDVFCRKRGEVFVLKLKVDACHWSFISFPKHREGVL